MKRTLELDRSDIDRAIGERRMRIEDLFAEMKSLVNTAAAEKRDLSRKEALEFDERSRDADALRAEIDELEQKRETVPRAVRQIRPTDGGESRDDTRNLLTREQSFLDAEIREGRSSTYTQREAEQFSLGRALRGQLTGRWDGADLERRALSEGTTTAGGFVTPELLSSRIIDRVRKQSRVLEAGAQTLRLGSDSVSIPRLSTGVTGAWRNENAAVSVEDPAFERVTFSPKSLAVLVKMSDELYEDMVDGGAELIDQELINALTLEVDRAALRGSGTPPEPAGLKNQTGVDEIGTVGSPTYADIMAAAGAIMGDNLEPTGVILNSRDWMTLGALVDTTGQPLRPPPIVENLPYFVSNQIPTNLGGGTESEIYVGDWRQLIIGIKPYVKIEVKTHGGPFDAAVKYDDSVGMANMQIWILCALRADVQVLHPEAFQILTGVTP